MTFRPIYENGKPAQWVKDLAGKSGVYLVRENFFEQVVYVGESHSGRLKKTLMHHFPHWTGPTAGPTFDPDTHSAAAITTPGENALEAQNGLISEYTPELNTQGNDWFKHLSDE